MSKRFFAALLSLPFALIGFAAQLTATLQSGDNVTPFYGTNAFVDAYNAAVDGDIITLSPGEFNVTDIKKGITVIGAYAFSDDASKSTIMKSGFTVSGDNVTLEGIRLASITMTIKAANNLTVRRSFFGTISDTENGDKKYHDNTILTDCIVSSYEAMSLSKNAVFRNCCINRFFDINESSYPALIENCNIPIFAHWSSSGVSTNYCQPYAIYRNCFLGLYNYGTATAPSLSLKSPSEFHSVIFFQNFYYDSGHSYAKIWTINYNSCIKDNVIMGGSLYSIGSDLTKVKLYSSIASYTYNNVTVGPSDVQKDPAIPAITSSEIDTETDDEGNLHVKISAVARD